MAEYKKGGLTGNSNLYATNRLFVKNPLFKKRKKKAPGVYNPTAKFRYKEGGVSKDPSIATLNQMAKGGEPGVYILDGYKYKKDSSGKWSYESGQPIDDGLLIAKLDQQAKPVGTPAITLAPKPKPTIIQKKTEYANLINSPLIANQEKAQKLGKEIRKESQQKDLYEPDPSNIIHTGKGFEATLNSALDYPMTKASIAASASGEDGSNEIDNLRHPLAGRYAAEAVMDYFPEWMQYTGIPQAAGFLGANVMGIGHEADVIFKDDRPWSTKLRESGEDIFNNAVGAGVGILPMSSKDKTNTLLELSTKNMLPDGMDAPPYNIPGFNTEHNMYFKKGRNDPGKFMSPYRQEYGGALDTYADGGTPSQIWEEYTGTPWSEAKARGLTDGSIEQNLALVKRLQSGEFGQPKKSTVTRSSTPKLKGKGTTLMEQFGMLKETLAPTINKVKTVGTKAYNSWIDEQSKLAEKEPKNLENKVPKNLIDPDWDPDINFGTKIDWKKEAMKPDSFSENVGEFIDFTGFSSHDDAYRAYTGWDESGEKLPSLGQAADMFGAVPVLGKFGKLKYLVKGEGLVKSAHKYFPWQQVVNAFDTVDDIETNNVNKKKNGGAIQDLSKEEIQKYIDGGYIVEEVNDPSIPALNTFAGGGEYGCADDEKWDEAKQKCVKIVQNLSESTHYDSAGKKIQTNLFQKLKDAKDAYQNFTKQHRGKKYRLNDADSASSIEQLRKGIQLYKDEYAKEQESTRAELKKLENLKSKTALKNNKDIQNLNLKDLNTVKGKMKIDAAIRNSDLDSGTIAALYKGFKLDTVDPNVMKEGYKGQWQDAVNEANARKEANMGVTNTALELLGGGAYRVAADPLGTLKGVGQTVGDIATLPFGLATGVYNYATDGNFDMGTNAWGDSYGKGLSQTGDVLSAIPGLGAAGKLAKFTKAGDLAGPAARGIGKFLGVPKQLPDSPNAVDFSKYLTQEEAVAARNERLISQKNKPGWNEQLTPDLEQRLSTAVENHNPASDYPGHLLGTNNPGRTSTEVSKNANSKGVPLNDANKSRVAAHETGHYYSNGPVEGEEWLSHFDLSTLDSRTRKYLRGNPRFENYANEIRERAAQLKDYIAQKNGIPLNQDFKITQAQLDDAIKNYVKDTGLDNSMSEMLAVLKNKKGLLKTMNKYPLSVIPIVGVAGTATMLANPFEGSDGLQQQKKGGSIDDSIEMDIPEEEIQWYIDNGYIVEPVTKLKKFIG
jgi:hypothetical protein